MRFGDLHQDDKIIRFHLFENTLEILESYQNPSQELKISFSPRIEEYGELYMEAVVREQSNNSMVVIINYRLGWNHRGCIDNIIPKKIDPEKIKHTDQFSEKGFSTDLGFRALRWIKDQIIKDAKSRGYEIKKIVSLNRHTGARAKSAQDTGKEINQSVSLKLKEYLVYEQDKITITESLDYF